MATQEKQAGMKEQVKKPEQPQEVDAVKLQFSSLFPPHVETVEIRESKTKGFWHLGFYDTNGRLASLIEISSVGAEGLVEKLANRLSKKE